MGVGTATTMASQAGNADYEAAADLAQSLSVGSASQTITFTAPPAKEKASGYRLHATVGPLGSTLLDTSLSDTSCTLAGLAFGSTVMWRVAPFNATGQAPFSPTAAITVRPAPPVPVDVARVPIQGKEGMGTTVELTWPPVDNSTGYRIQASLDGAQAPLIDTVISQPPFTLQELAPGGSMSGAWRR